MYGGNFAEFSHTIDGQDGTVATPSGIGAWKSKILNLKAERTIDYRVPEMGPEYFIPRDQFLTAFKKILDMKEILRPVLRGIEIRPVDGDDYLMSPAYKQEVIAIHFNFSIDVR